MFLLVWYNKVMNKKIRDFLIIVTIIMTISDSLIWQQRLFILSVAGYMTLNNRRLDSIEKTPPKGN